MLTSLAADVAIRFDAVDCTECDAAGIRFAVARLDEIDAQISGNKWFKLRHNLLQAEKTGIRRVVSFGGAWSNHLHALAAAGARFGFETVGIVRGEAAHGLTPTLTDANAWGMQLHFVDRAEYKRRHDADYIEQLARQYAPCVVIPEGGSNALGVSGCEVIARALTTAEFLSIPDCLSEDDSETRASSKHVVLASATGATLGGLARALGSEFTVHAIAVLHAHESLQQSLDLYAPQRRCKVNIVGGYEHGGYARTSAPLLDFMQAFERKSTIALDHVYTGKAMYAFYDLLQQGMFGRGSKVVFLHTGGLQGLRGLQVNSRSAGKVSIITGWR